MRASRTVRGNNIMTPALLAPTDHSPCVCSGLCVRNCGDEEQNRGLSTRRENPRSGAAQGMDQPQNSLEA